MMFSLKKHSILGVLLISGLCSLSLSAMASTEKINIPALSDAKFFAQYTDELPAVINYFTRESEQTVIEFYQAQYGEATSSEMKRGRLTLHFNADGKDLRVVISKQGNRVQVDALLNK